MSKVVFFVLVVFIIMGFFLLSSCDVLNSFFRKDVGANNILTNVEEKQSAVSNENIEAEKQLDISKEATSIIPFTAHMYGIKDFDAPASFLSTIEKASKFAFSSKIKGIKENDYIHLFITPNSTDVIYFKLDDLDIYYNGQVFIIPYQWRDWIKETYTRVVGSIQFLGENTTFTSALLSFSGGTSYVPLCYILKIRNQNGDYYKLIVTTNYKGPTSYEAIYELYNQLFNNFDSTEQLGFVVVYGVFSDDKYVDDFALGILYTGLNETIPNQNTYFIPITGLK
ncbi:hypothetical protein SU69_07535 [Thermosipho melanesiensis]|uniref:Lipoprotein n=2 Tax=Thermosipho melanesiensis TaxID=46541 RepID=A6LN28_THEM4|nr:hypothetical protein [Thermosipho melanesiensis]ABR31329.1 hypothetical protein Tmel_1482 [Thermosipho melanesiensis BI429]APT74923.1 hypothetical protein BW47_07890 [Thermosipho melanesiensis]OOC36352.1 hypothetical protein SU68_07605 [Thermosipho melanesiensis]OOC37170.1 hypothetical protein SU69_07535 [Thermosipho melanesiensis]OOC37922.1 hypothetical protein SU70_07545 [Thermosipho melanesiensis]